MDKNTKNVTKAETKTENVNGPKTSESFDAYTKLRNPRLKFNFPIILLYVFIFSLLLASALIFASSIKTAYFSSHDSQNGDNNINTIKSSYQNNENIKVETVTEEVADLFGLPIGVKIIELNNSDPYFNGLKANDIIVEVSGKQISDIEDMEFISDRITSESFIVYTVYRNGVYKTIDPFDDTTN